MADGWESAPVKTGDGWESPAQVSTPATSASPQGQSFLGKLWSEMPGPDIVRMAISQAAQPVAGLAGAVTGAVTGNHERGADVVRSIEKATAYRPTSHVGKAVEEVLGLPGKLWNPVVEAAGEKASKAGPLAGALAKGLTAVAPMAAGEVLGRIAPKLNRPLTAEEKSTAAAKAKGFKLTAEESHAGPVTKFAESVAGEPTFSKVIARGNQPVVNEIVAKDIGVKPGTDFTPELFSQLRKESGVPYAEMRKIGKIKTDAQYAKDLDAVAAEYKTAARDFPEQARPDIIKFVDDMKKESFAGDSGLDMVDQLRKSATQAYTKGDKGLGAAMRETADAIEEQMGRHIEKTSAFQPAGLLRKWRAARVRLAKINLAEKSVNPATGDVDPTFYSRAYKQRKPLTGEALDLGKAAAGHERSIRATAKLGSTGPSWWDLIVGIGSKHHLLFGLRPALRTLLSSEPYQKMFMHPGPGAARQALAQPAFSTGMGAAASMPPNTAVGQQTPASIANVNMAPIRNPNPATILNDSLGAPRG